jgi:hypothetical protein
MEHDMTALPPSELQHCRYSVLVLFSRPVCRSIVKSLGLFALGIEIARQCDGLLVMEAATV